MDSKMHKPTDFYEALVLHFRGDHAKLEAWQRKREARGQKASLIQVSIQPARGVPSELLYGPVKQFARNTWCRLNGEGVVAGRHQKDKANQSGPEAYFCCLVATL
jgi:hypothetical protein